MKFDTGRRDANGNPLPPRTAEEHRNYLNDQQQQHREVLDGLIGSPGIFPAARQVRAPGETLTGDRAGDSWSAPAGSPHSGWETSDG
jgi:hypothetical protein